MKFKIAKITAKFSININHQTEINSSMEANQIIKQNYDRIKF